MAYINQTQGNHRPLIFTGVALLHAAAGYLIVTGLAVTYMREVMPVFTARNIPIEQRLPKASPPPPTEDKSVVREVEQIRLPFPVPDQGATINIPIEQPTLPPMDFGTIEAKPTVAPSFSPRFAKPRGSTEGWATTNDYPARDLREGNQGTTRFLLTIGADGKVMSCAIVKSSGFPGLDKATCDNVSRRARFEAATDETGAKVQGTYSSAIRWVIPD